MSNSKLVVRHLQKTYGKRTVVSNVSLDVASGEVVGLDRTALARQPRFT